MLEAAALQRRRIMPLFIVLIVGACAPLIAEFSLEAYKNATTLKAETAALIDKAGEPYSAHAEEVAALTTKMNVAYEFAAGLPSNQLSAQQWQIMRDPNRNLYGGFVSLWKDPGNTIGGISEGKEDTDKPRLRLHHLLGGKQEGNYTMPRSR